MNSSTLILMAIAGVSDYALDRNLKKALILAAVVGLAYHLICVNTLAEVNDVSDYPSVA